jgi:hypothetical protein
MEPFLTDGRVTIRAGSEAGRGISAARGAIRGGLERPEATDALRTLIDRIVLYPGERRGELRAELHGELGAILALSQGGGKTNRTPTGMRFSSGCGDSQPPSFAAAPGFLSAALYPNCPVSPRRYRPGVSELLAVERRPVAQINLWAKRSQ